MAPPPASTALSGFHWEDNMLEFELADAGKQIACSISREALEDAGAGQRARNWQLQEVFDRYQKKIIRLLQQKHSTAKANSRSALHISTDDLNVTALPAAGRSARA